jgi:hypothetical protein
LRRRLFTIGGALVCAAGIAIAVAMGLPAAPTGQSPPPTVFTVDFQMSLSGLSEADIN